jgi:beta-phosphoglucomutase-like phosphatase (HAD superfamily)
MNAKALPVKLEVFDMAGTIVEDRGEVAAAFARALQESNLPFTNAELKEWKGA